MNTPSAKMPQRGDTLDVLGNLITFALRGGDTGMRFSMVECYTGPGAGSPPHLHTEDEEAFFVLDGTYRFHLGDQVVTRGPGTLTHVPKGVPHAFENPGEQPSRMMILNWPADHHERFFAAIGTPVEAGTRKFAAPRAPDMPAIFAAAEASGIKLLIPAMAE